MTKRERGEGSVYLRGRTWWVQYSVRGRVYRESSRSTERRTAVHLLRKRLSEVAAGQHTPDAERVHLDDLLQFVEDDYTINGRRSLDRVRRDFVHLRSYFGNDRALDITSDRVASYARVRMNEDAAAGTIARELATLKRGFSLAVRAGRLHHRPAFPTIQVNDAKAGFFEEAEFRALLAELPEYLHAPLRFAYLTGWRLQSEVLTLRWPQVDLEAGIVRLEPGMTKNRDGREWPVNALPELAQLLQKQRETTRALERETGSVIPWVFHRNGRPIKSLRTAWRNACRRAGLVGMIPHDFRRTAVRNLERAGVPRSVAMKLVGHRTESIYRRYAIVAPRDLAEGVAKLASLRDTTTAEAEVRTIIPLSA